MFIMYLKTSCIEAYLKKYLVSMLKTEEERTQWIKEEKKKKPKNKPKPETKIKHK